MLPDACSDSHFSPWELCVPSCLPLLRLGPWKEGIPPVDTLIEGETLSLRPFIPLQLRIDLLKIFIFCVLMLHVVCFLVWGKL